MREREKKKVYEVTGSPWGRRRGGGGVKARKQTRDLELSSRMGLKTTVG